MGFALCVRFTSTGWSGAPWISEQFGEQPGKSHGVTHMDLSDLKQTCLTQCNLGEGCHDFASGGCDGLSAMANTFDVWLGDGGDLNSIDYVNSQPADELYKIPL